MLPMLVYPLPTSWQIFQTYMDLLTCSIWTLDIGFGMCTGYFDACGLVQVDLRLAGSYYLRTWFTVDMFVSVCDWANIVLSMSTLEQGRIATRMMSRTLRIMRLMKLWRLSMSASGFLSNMQSKMVTVVTIVKQVLIIIIVSHYVAACWYFV
jgi:hypothetical protein